MAFQKGKSGNPGGRPREERSLKDLARAHTATAVKTLVAIMKNRKAPSAARVHAACALLDRGYGKPAQTMALKADLTLAALLEKQGDRD